MRYRIITWGSTIIAALALVLSSIGLATSVEASNKAAQEANARVKSNRDTFCDFTKSIANLRAIDTPPSTPTGAELRDQLTQIIVSANIATDKLNCPDK